MATPSAALLDRLEKQGIPKSKRKLQKHLRSAGLAYISRTGKLIPAKKVAEELCQCPQKCDERVPMEARERLFTHFYGLGDADLQNQFLRQNMDLRARLNIPENHNNNNNNNNLTTTTSGRPPRRITCKYLVPILSIIDNNNGIDLDNMTTVEVCQKAFVSAFVITTKRVRLQREKLISSLGLNSYSSHNRNNNNNNNNNITNNNNKSQLITENNNNNNNHKKATLNLKFLSNSCEFVDCTISPEPKNYYNDNDDDDDNDNNDIQIPNNKPTMKRLVDNPLIPFGLFVPDGVTIAPVTATPDHDRDIAIVNNFFSNQLWKPEYIGTYS